MTNKSKAVQKYRKSPGLAYRGKFVPVFGTISLRIIPITVTIGTSIEHEGLINSVTMKCDAYCRSPESNVYADDHLLSFQLGRMGIYSPNSFSSTTRNR